MVNSNCNLKVAYVVNDAAFFVGHIIPIAKKIMERGGKVYLITGKNINKAIETEAINHLKAHKISHYVCTITRTKERFFEFHGLIQVIKYLKILEPDVIHSATPKGNFIASMACNFIKRTKLIMSVTGLGRFS